MLAMHREGGKNQMPADVSKQPLFMNAENEN
jgi:hypothetical protein